MKYYIHFIEIIHLIKLVQGKSTKYEETYTEQSTNWENNIHRFRTRLISQTSTAESIKIILTE